MYAAFNSVRIQLKMGNNPQNVFSSLDISHIHLCTLSLFASRFDQLHNATQTSMMMVDLIAPTNADSNVELAVMLIHSWC